MKLHVVVSSTRPGRIGPQIADWFAGQVDPASAQSGFDVEIIDLADVGLPMLDEPNHPADQDYLHEHTRNWSASVASADAFVFVMAEYNTGFTAPLKNALDYLYSEWHYKPVGFVSYGMTSSGMRAVEMVKPVVVSLKMVPVQDAVTIALRAKLDADGVLHPDERMTEAANDLVTELRVLAEMLAPIREGAAVREAELIQVGS